MIEKRDLDVFPLCDALCDYFNRVVNRYAERINNYIEEQEEELEDYTITFEVLNEGEFLLFDFVDREEVIESINDELEAIGNGDFYITDYKADRVDSYIDFDIERLVTSLTITKK